MRHTIPRGQHAEERMEARGVTPEQVAWVLEHHHTSYETPQRSKCFEGTIGGRTLKVWIVWPISRSDGLAIVKSVAWKGEE